MDISRLLKFYEKKIGAGFDKNDPFLVKYDKNKNSVFDKEEMDALKNDLQKYAGIDFDEKNISNSEYVQLYNSKVDKEHKEYNMNNLGRELENSVRESELKDSEQSQMEQPTHSEFTEETPELTPEEEARVAKYKNSEKYAGCLSKRDYPIIAKFDDKRLEQFESLLEILAENDRLEAEAFDVVALIDIINDEKDFDYAKKFLSNGMNTVDISYIMMYGPERHAIADLIVDKVAENTIPQENSSEGQLSFESISGLIEGSDEKIKRVTDFLERKGELFNSDNLVAINMLCESETKNFDRIYELLDSRTNENIGDPFRILAILDLDDSRFQKAKEIYANPDYDKIAITPLIDIDENKRARVKDIIENSQSSYFGVTELCKLNDEQLSNLEKLKGLTLGGKQVELELLIKLSKCSPEGIEKVKQMDLPDSKISQEVMTLMAEANDDTLNNFIADHPDYIFVANLSKGILNIAKPLSGLNKTGIDTMCYNLKTGSFEALNDNIETHNSTKVVKSTGENKIQEIEYERIASDGVRSNIVKNQEIKIYDNNGRLIKTEKYEPGVHDGVPNITEIDSKGNKKILQQSKRDKNGNLKIEKNFTSPEGVQTQFQSVEDDLGNKRSVYKITDKDGNVLMNRVQSFKVLGENKFQSTLNDRSWEIEYTDDKISIKDLNSGNTSEIPIGEKFQGNKEAFKNIIKTMSAEQLLIMNISDVDIMEFPEVFDGIADTEYQNNAYWRSNENKIYLGETSFTPTQQSFLERNRSTLAHEYGHFIDHSAERLNGRSISENETIRKIFQEECAAFRETATSEEEKFIDYFTGTMQGIDRGSQEQVAETNLFLHNNSTKQTATRGYYLQRNFPRTVAAIAEEIEKIEQQALEKADMN